jgi:hypothetical protein
VTLDFAAALERLDRAIAELALTKCLSIISAISLDSPAFDGAPIRYRITLQNGTAKAVVYLDHEALIDAEECFAVLTLPQLDAALGRLAHSATQCIG